MKYYKLIGIVACALLIAGSFAPLAYYPDLHRNFTGFFSEKNIYGKPGKVFVFFAVVSIVMIYLNAVWAKRTLIFLAALNIGYLIKTYVLFSSCYRAICPILKYGMYLLVAGAILLMITALLPNTSLKEKDLKTEEGLPTE